jgi:hypothetical protein
MADMPVIVAMGEVESGLVRWQNIGWGRENPHCGATA